MSSNPSDRVIDHRYAPRHGWTCIGRPDDPFKSLVREDGALLYQFHNFGLDAWRFDRVFEFRLRADGPPVAVHQSTESARVPIVTTRLDYPKASLTLQAIGHQHGDRRTDILLWTVSPAAGVDEFVTQLCITGYAPFHYFAPATIAPGNRIYAGREEGRPEWDFWELVTRHHVEPAEVTPPGPLAFVSLPHTLRLGHAQGFTSASGLSTELFAVGGDQTVQGALLFPQNHDQLDGVDYDWAVRAVEAERRFWQGAALQPLALQTPDPAVNDMLVSCARNILQAREIEDGLPVFKVGPTLYRNLFVVDGHFFLEAAQYLGYAEDAAAGIDTLLRHKQPDGSFAIIPDHNKETGIALATLVRQSELSGDWERLRREWPTVLQAVAFIRGLRAQAAALDPDHVCYRLLPEGFCDGGLGGKRPEYSTVLWTLFGLKEIARAAALLAMPEADAFRAEFEGLLADFRRSAQRDMQTTPEGTPYLPMRIPGGSSDHHWIPDYPLAVPAWHGVNPGTATWALAQTIYPGEVFPADDPLVANFCTLLDQLDEEQGIPAATGWLPYQSLWGYAASFYAHVWLYVGCPDKAVDYLYAFANHAYPTRIWREEQSLVSSGHGKPFGDMPHNWASVEFIRLVRNLLVLEQDDRLHLLAGLPPEWIYPGAALRVEKTPTRFGPVSLDLTVHNDLTFDLTVAFDPSWPTKPQVVSLQLPRLAGVQVNGQPRPAQSSLPLEGESRYQITGAFHSSD